MELGLQGKAAVVTGGSVGIGKAIALELAREGVDVAICARRADMLEQAAKDIESQTSSKIVAIQTDTTSRESVENMVDTAMLAFGKIDILVNNAAYPGGLVQGPLSDAKEEDLLADINTKVVGYFRCAKAVAPHMQSQGWGRIVNIGGLSGRRSGTISGLRNISLVHLTKTLSDQLGPSGITVNLVHPGTTRTERSGPMYAERARREGVTVEQIEGLIAQNIPIRRIVDAQEVAYVVTFLASERAAAVTGETVSAGGGSGNAVHQ
jgi:NAD(P)-dependent dehydrogenase (short-subunit alcohol dehydrogenase family)